MKKILKGKKLQNKKYTTNYKDIKKYFKYFNKKLFKSKLNKFNDIKIRNMNCSGQCVENISYYKGTSFFVIILYSSNSSSFNFTTLGKYK